MTKEKQFLQLLKQQVEYWKNKTDTNYSVEAESRWSEANYILTLFYSLQSDVNDNSEIPKDLEEAAKKYAHKGIPDEMKHVVEPVAEQIIKNFIAGAKWQAEQLLKSSPVPEDTVLFNKGVEEGKRLMMEEAVEGVVTNADGVFGYDVAAFRFDDNHTYSVLLPHEEKRKYGDKVRIIIVKEDET